jgi:hypothetical protein
LGKGQREVKAFGVKVVVVVVCGVFTLFTFVWFVT